MNATKDIHAFIEFKYQNLILALLEQLAGTANLCSYPIAAHIAPSNACNLKCKFCLQSRENKLLSPDVMNWNLFRQIADELGPYLFHANLIGYGESFLNKRLADMIALLKKYGVKVVFTTNFSMPLSNEIFESLIRNKLDSITIGIDGISQETYERHRVGGDFDLAMSNMKRLTKLKRKLGASKPNITWQFIVFSFNEHEIPEAKNLAKQLGVNLKLQSPYVDIPGFDENKDYYHWLPKTDEYVMDRYKYQQKKRRECQPIKRKINSMDEYMKNLTHKFDLKHPCDFLFLRTMINPNGSVSACCAVKAQEYDYGQINNLNSFHDVWNSEAFQKSRKIVCNESNVNLANTESTICINCPAPELRRRAHSEVSGALREAPDEVWKQASKLLPYHMISRNREAFHQSFGAIIKKIFGESVYTNLRKVRNVIHR